MSAAAVIGVSLCLSIDNISSGDDLPENWIADAACEKPRVFTTTFGESAVELRPDDMLLEKPDWPDFPPPLEINSYFYAPFRVWHVAGGYLGAFDGGEFGGGLFFATNGTRKWRRVLDRHILTMAPIGRRCYVAAGGLAHLGFPAGWVYLVSQDMRGRWSAKQVFSSTRDIPKIFAETDMTNVVGDREHLVIFRLHPFIAQGVGPEDSEDLRIGDVRSPEDMLFGVNANGVISFMGKIEEYEKGKDEPATPNDGGSAPGQPQEGQPPAKPGPAP